jgi:hypothetical protein
LDQIEFRKIRDFGELLSVTFEFVRINFIKMGKALLFISGPLILLSGIASAVYQTSILDMDGSIGTGMVGSFFMYFFFILMTSVSIALVTNSYIKLYIEHGNNNFDLNVVWEDVKSKFWMILFTSIGQTIAVILGAVLLILPGAYLAVALSIIYIVRYEENLGFFDSFNRCLKLIKGRWWFTLAFLLLLVVILYAAIFAFQVPQYILLFITSINSLEDGELSFNNPALIITSIFSSLSYFVYSIVYVGLAFHYYNLVEQKEAPGLLAKIDAIESPVS